MIASQAIPIPLIAPLLVFWLGFGIGPKLIVIGIVSFFPVVVTTLARLETVDPDMLRLMRTFDAGRATTFRHVELPAALPGVFTGAKLAAVFSVIGAVLGRAGRREQGPWLPVLSCAANFEIARGVSPRSCSCPVFAIALFVALTLIERRALPWAYQQTGDTR